MIEAILWLALSVVMYFAGRYDMLKEIETGTWGLEWVDAHHIRLHRKSTAKGGEAKGR